MPISVPHFLPPVLSVAPSGLGREDEVTVTSLELTTISFISSVVTVFLAIATQGLRYTHATVTTKRISERSASF